MIRRGNCHDNTVAESFFQLLKRERIKRKLSGKGFNQKREAVPKLRKTYPAGYGLPFAYARITVHLGIINN